MLVPTVHVYVADATADVEEAAVPPVHVFANLAANDWHPDKVFA
jgi:hypothetical protein